MCGMVVVDAGINFLAIFEAMCDVLTIRFHAAAMGNHKAVSIQHYFRFLNKAVTIATSDCATTLLFGSLLPTLPASMH